MGQPFKNTSPLEMRKKMKSPLWGAKLRLRKMRILLNRRFLGIRGNCRLSQTKVISNFDKAIEIQAKQRKN
jgi:hypothetical protein